MAIMSFIASILSLWNNVSPGITGILISACLAAFLYWAVFPERIRPVGLVLFSVVTLAASGATVWFVLLLVILTLLANVAASDVRRDSNSFFSLQVLAASVYVVGITTCLLWGALWVGSKAGFADILDLYVLWSALQVGHLPQLGWLLSVWGTVLSLFSLAAAAVILLQKSAPVIARRLLSFFVMFGLVGAFIVLKLHPLSLPGLVTWVGFSYFAFRLLHVLIDSLNGQYTNASPIETLVYALFFPALLVGPIDRLPRFMNDMHGDAQVFRWGYVVEGITRILIGGVKKFFLADLLLSKLALGQNLLSYTESAFAWLQLYSYALYIFFDFSGYTDIAIGMGRLLGYSLPENFISPYLKPSITRFWQSWHVTLSNWLRDYTFFPLSRRLLQTTLRRSPYLILFVAHMTTMVLIGLWHGISFNFALWGAWHGFGLFVHKVFADKTRRWPQYSQKYPLMAMTVEGLSTLLTFHFVTLGWVFFVLPLPSDSIPFFLRLFGISS